MSEGEVLTNIEFDFPFNGKVYKVKKAKLYQVIDWQRKVTEIGAEKDAAADLRMAAYAIYLALKSVDPNITEDEILKNCDGDIDVMDIFAKLGFMSRQKVEAMGKIRNALANQPNGGNSSVS